MHSLLRLQTFLIVVVLSIGTQLSATDAWDVQLSRRTRQFCGKQLRQSRQEVGDRAAFAICNIDRPRCNVPLLTETSAARSIPFQRIQEPNAWLRNERTHDPSRLSVQAIH